MSRYWSKREGGRWVGVISCSRPRCREEHEWPVEHEPAFPTYDPRESQATRKRLGDQQEAAQKELEEHPLPAGWVKLRYMLYQEEDKDNPDFFVFHSPHCAALYLNALPGAKADLPRRVRRPGGDPILRAGGP